VADHEQLHMIVVKHEPWSVENGFLTPTMKVRRGRIEKAMEPHVESWYALKRRVHWH
jgi:long-subunit acyl-CoA synthetase (AMP-forming)